MCLRYLALALIMGLWAIVEGSTVFAQGNTDSEQLINPAAPIPSPAEGTAPNPFRTTDIPAEPFGSPGFAEASDQDGPAQVTPNNQRPNRGGQRSTTNNLRPTPTPVSTSRNSTRNNNTFSPRLARAAPIMGDSFAPSLQYTNVNEYDHLGAQFPTSGGATRGKIGENTAAFPQDRFVFNYNHFHNAIESFGDSSNADRFTFGVEKTFFSNLCSIDVRFPLTADNDVDNGSFTRNGTEVGNLLINLKLLLTSDENSAIVAGMTIDTPTGGDVEASFNGDTFLRVHNEALHLSPFLGFLCIQDDLFTHQGFLQVDVPTNANGVSLSDTTPASVSSEFMEQTLLYVDYSLSTTLHEAGRSSRDTIQRVSGLAEMHYTTTLEESDEVVFNTALNNDFRLSSVGNRLDVVNLTFGLDTLLDCGANVRFGTVVPITDSDDRFFDIEFQAQLNVPL